MLFFFVFFVWCRNCKLYLQKLSTGLIGGSFVWQTRISGEVSEYIKKQNGADAFAAEGFLIIDLDVLRSILSWDELNVKEIEL
jgi:hypothetical protein